ncbi:MULTISPECIES: hypothetical protein [Mycolicibacterium]|jgi:hypothetical protein|uniref:hypothetical protein n=1 Tax=Mycolicibacterium TaxID=1866885 RepID=UPI001EF53516|nr:MULTISPECIES: hypothetical protein [Mycolicibacterium]MCG7583913.1 hypothetical protein [Mycolicibacterium sp. OfavD-34-C]
MSDSCGVEIPPITNAELAPQPAVAVDTANATEANAVPQAMPALRMLIRMYTPGLLKKVRFAVIGASEAYGWNADTYRAKFFFSNLRKCGKHNDAEVQANSARYKTTSNLNLVRVILRKKAIVENILRL